MSLEKIPSTEALENMSIIASVVELETSRKYIVMILFPQGNRIDYSHHNFEILRDYITLSQHKRPFQLQ